MYAGIYDLEPILTPNHAKETFWDIHKKLHKYVTSFTRWKLF